MLKLRDLHGYETTEDGQIWSTRLGRYLKQSKDNYGYMVVHVLDNGRRRTLKVHRLVGFSWIPLVAGKNCINHKDGNKANNHASNLEWVTHKENTQHAYAIGLCENRLAPVAKYSISGKLLRVYPSQTEAAKEIGCSPKNIGSVVSGKEATARGWRWAALQVNGKPLLRLPPLKTNRVSVAQYTISGKFLRVFGSIAEATYYVGCAKKSIGNVLSKRTSTAGGFRWEYLQANSKPLKSLPPMNKPHPKMSPVLNVTTGEIFTTHAQLQEAGYTPSAVNYSSRNKGSVHAGCLWKKIQQEKTP